MDSIPTEIICLIFQSLKDKHKNLFSQTSTSESVFDVFSILKIKEQNVVFISAGKLIK